MSSARVNPLRQLSKLGQSVWLDYVSGSLIVGGELAHLIKKDGLEGVTSNPSIFEKAIGGSTDHDEALATFEGKADADVLRPT